MGIFGPPNIDKLKAKKNIKGLINAFKYKDNHVLDAAVLALVEIGKPVVETLVAALKNKDGNIREYAAEALDKLGWEPGKDESGAFYWVVKRNWDMCIRIGAPALKALVATLSDSSVCEHAVATMGKIGERSFTPLFETLEGLNWGFWGGYITEIARYYKTFIRVGNKSTVGILIVVLNSLGTQSMAEDFLNCGNGRLAETAEDWAYYRNYTINQVTGSGGPAWGSSHLD